MHDGSSISLEEPNSSHPHGCELNLRIEQDWRTAKAEHPRKICFTNGQAIKCSVKVLSQAQISFLWICYGISQTVPSLISHNHD